MKKTAIAISVVIACIIMGIVDAIIQPGYVVKSVIKVILFLMIPLLYSFVFKDKSVFRIMKSDRKGVFTALALGAAIYIIIMAAYMIFRNVFDFSSLTASLSQTTGVNKNNFLWVALYISFVNSLLEEFFFRGFAYLALKQNTSTKFACIFSSLTFALYHIAMMIGWFGLPVILISLAGLFVGGVIFDVFDDKKGNIYLSWLIHMFANFSINTIGFILFSV